MTQSFFKYLELDFHNRDHYPDVFQHLRDDKLQGIMVHGLYSQQVLTGLVEQLSVNGPGFLQTWFPEAFRSWFYGCNLNLTEPNLQPYFDEAKKFNATLEKLIIDGESLPSRLTGLFSSLDRGKPFIAAPGVEQDTQHYMFTTFRCHQTQGYIPPHSDNEFMLRPSYRHLVSICKPNILSFVLVFSCPQAGGETAIYDFRTPGVSADIISDDRYGQRPDLDNLPCRRISIPAGSLLIFNSGTYLHSLMPVKGDKPRWTACSFMAQSKDGACTYCWG